MKVQLPTISAINGGSVSSTIESSEKTSTGDIVFNYKISFTAITNELLNNDAVSVKVSIQPETLTRPTNDFEKIASGDNSPILSLNTRGFSSLEERSSQSSESKSSSLSYFSGGTTTSDNKKVNFSKNNSISKALLKSHIQLKESISENSEQESLQEIASETRSIDSFISDLSKKELARSKMLNSITSGTGDSISLSATTSEIFFDGGVKFTLQKRRISRSNNGKSESTIPVLDTVLVQRESTSNSTNIGQNAVEYNVDPLTGEVVESSVTPSNISQSTSQDELSGVLERASIGQTGVSSIEKDPQVAAMSAISKYGVAASQIVSMSISDFINTARDNYEGTSRRMSPLNTSYSQVKSLNSDDLNQISNSLRSKFVNISPVSQESISDLPSMLSVTSISETTTEDTDFEYSFQVPTSKISNPGEFNVIIDLIDSEGRTIQTETKVIDHKKNINEFYTVIAPPVITAAESEDSMMHMVVKQVDKNANKIIILQKTISPSKISQSGGFNQIDRFSLTQKNAPVIKSYPIASGNPTIIRAVAVSASGEMTTFSDIVVKPSRRNIDMPVEDEILEMSINSKNSNKGILVEAKIISGDPVGIYFLRKNLTNRDRKYIPINSAGSNSLASRGKTFQITDTSVVEENVYEYRCKAVFNTGVERISEASTIEKRMIVRDSVSIDADPPSVRRSSTLDGYEISINASMNIPESDADITKSILDDLDLSDLFSEDISDIKDQLSSVSVFRVKRFDVNTGIEYDLGIKTSGNFKDVGDTSMGIPSPKSASEYIYKLEPLMRTTTGILSELKSTQAFRELKQASFMPSLSVEKSSSSSSTKFDTNFSEKFTSPTAIRQGTLSYGGALVSNHASNSFELGETGIVKSINVSTPSSSISITKPSVSAISTGDVKIGWFISGNIDTIDHFIITANRNGVTIPVGVHHAQSNSGNFTFTDTSQKGILGDVEYSITPILSDLTQGNTSVAGSISITGEF